MQIFFNNVSKNIFSHRISVDVEGLSNFDLTQRFSGVFRWNKIGTLTRNGLLRSTLNIYLASTLKISIIEFWVSSDICDALHDLLPFVQLKNVKNTHGGVLILLKLTLLHGCFSHFFNCTNGTKSRNASHMLGSYNVQEYTYMNSCFRYCFNHCVFDCLLILKHVCLFYTHKDIDLIFTKLVLAYLDLRLANSYRPYFFELKGWDCFNGCNRNIIKVTERLSIWCLSGNSFHHERQTFL